MLAVRRILSYLKTTPGKGILFKARKELDINGFSDADYPGSITDRRSTSGYCVYPGGNLVSWGSKKQTVVARSSAKAEFRAMALSLCEVLWLKIILEDLKIQIQGPIGIRCDNQTAISIAHNPVRHDKTKHFEIDKHFVKEKLEAGLIQLPYVPSKDQVANILTKGLPANRFDDLTNKVEMYDIHSIV